MKPGAVGTGRDVTFAVAFTPTAGADSTNLRRTSDVAATYYNALAGALASARRWGPSDLVLITTEPPPLASQQLLDALDIHVAIIPFLHRPPPGFWPKFNGSLFALDAVDYLCSLGDSRLNILIDPDCYVVNDWAVTANFPEDSFAALRLGVPEDWSNNGLSAIQASRLHQELDPSLSGVAPSFGGEWYAFRRLAGRRALTRAESAYEESLRRWSGGIAEYGKTEEHLFNYAFRNVPVFDMAPYLRRIWTTPTYRVVQPTDVDLVAWHLPAEKDRALWSLRRVIADPRSWFHQAEGAEFRRRLGRAVGIPKRSPTRFGYDEMALTARWLQAGGKNTRGAVARASNQ